MVRTKRRRPSPAGTYTCTGSQAPMQSRPTGMVEALMPLAYCMRLSVHGTCTCVYVCGCAWSIGCAILWNRVKTDVPAPAPAPAQPPQIQPKRKHKAGHTTVEESPEKRMALPFLPQLDLPFYEDCPLCGFSYSTVTERRIHMRETHGCELR